MAKQTIKREIQSVSVQEQSTAVFGDWNLNFMVNKRDGKAFQIEFNGHKQSGENLNGRLDEYNINSVPPISFSTTSAVDSAVATAIAEEIEAIKAVKIPDE